MRNGLMLLLVTLAAAAMPVAADDGAWFGTPVPPGVSDPRKPVTTQLEPGDTAGYERAYRTDRPVWLATLPVGHADGLPRSAAKGGRVRIGDAMYPIVASVSASHSIVEIGAEPRVATGDVATIFDARDGSRPEDLAASCNSSVYDLTMHLHADLPRRVI